MNVSEDYAASIFTLKMEALWISETLVLYHKLHDVTTQHPLLDFLSTSPNIHFFKSDADIKGKM
jgi:hypothetical protein